MTSAICETTFQDFAQARAAAERQAAALRHDMEWMTWGSPPRCGLAICGRCSRRVLIERTRVGTFRLQWSTQGSCPRLVFAALETESAARKIA